MKGHMKYKTTQDRVVIKQEAADTVSETGLIISRLSAEENNIGQVVAIGDGTLTKKNIKIPVAVKVGDRVMFVSGTGIKVNVDGCELLVLKESDIIGIFD